MSENTSKSVFLDFLFLTIGAVFMAAGIGVFLVDAKVVPGGVSGLAMAAYYLTEGALPVGITIWVVNIPLFIWGLKELGKTFGIRTFYSFTISSLMIDILRGEFPGLKFNGLQNTAMVQDLFANDFLFLIIVGAAFLGLGLGIIFKFKGTTAGSDIVAAIMQKHFGLKPGQAIMIIDFFVIALAGLIIQVKNISPDKPALSLTLYALFLLFISSRLIDIILDGFDYVKAAYIISDKYVEIGETIMNKFKRGATAIKTRGLYRNIEREVLMTIVTQKELSPLIDTVKEIDPDAFIVINNVHEVLGRGFRRRF